MEINKTSTSPGGRITVIDALRGFSLIGICLIHAMQHFGAIGTMAPQAMFPWEGTLNEIFRWFINYLVFGKFFIIFSCLFGLSFFIQMDRAAKKGLDFRKRFLWRLLLLAVIGYLHGLIVRVDIFADICDIRFRVGINCINGRRNYWQVSPCFFSWGELHLYR